MTTYIVCQHILQLASYTATKKSIEGIFKA